jgi:hypothetical protein
MPKIQQSFRGKLGGQGSQSVNLESRALKDAGTREKMELENYFINYLKLLLLCGTLNLYTNEKVNMLIILFVTN